MSFSPAPWYGDPDDDSGDTYGVVYLVDHPPAHDPGTIHGIGPNPTRANVTQAIFEWGSYLDYDVDLTLAWVADLVADVVQVGLWALGLDPTWPPCAEHSGRHPLRAVAEQETDGPRSDARTELATSGAWRCYQPIVTGDQYQAAYGATAIPIGRLAIRGGLATIAD